MWPQDLDNFDYGLDKISMSRVIDICFRTKCFI